MSTTKTLKSIHILRAFFAICAVVVTTTAFSACSFIDLASKSKSSSTESIPVESFLIVGATQIRGDMAWNTYELAVTPTDASIFRMSFVVRDELGATVANGLGAGHHIEWEQTGNTSFRIRASSIGFFTFKVFYGGMDASKNITVTPIWDVVP